MPIIMCITVKNRREATCTQTGYTGDTYCTDCDKLLRTGEELEALGHDYKATVTATNDNRGKASEPTPAPDAAATQRALRSCRRNSTLLNYTGIITRGSNLYRGRGGTYTCSCGRQYTENIPATGHSLYPKVTKVRNDNWGRHHDLHLRQSADTVTQPIAKIKSDDSGEGNGSQTRNRSPAQTMIIRIRSHSPIVLQLSLTSRDDSGKEGWDVIEATAGRS